MWGQFKYWYKTCARLFESHWILGSIIKKSFVIKKYLSGQLSYKSMDSIRTYFSIHFTGWLEKFITLSGIIWRCWYENRWQMSIWLRWSSAETLPRYVSSPIGSKVITIVTLLILLITSHFPLFQFGSAYTFSINQITTPANFHLKHSLSKNRCWFRNSKMPRCLIGLSVFFVAFFRWQLFFYWYLHSPHHTSMCRCSKLSSHWLCKYEHLNSLWLCKWVKTGW